MHFIFRMEQVLISIFLIASLECGYGLRMKAPQLSPEEMSGNFEGDILINGEELKPLMNPRSGLVNERTRWHRNENGIVLVPFQIRAGSPFGMT